MNNNLKDFQLKLMFSLNQGLKYRLKKWSVLKKIYLRRKILHVKNILWPRSVVVEVLFLAQETMVFNNGIPGSKH